MLLPEQFRFDFLALAFAQFSQRYGSRFAPLFCLAVFVGLALLADFGCSSNKAIVDAADIRIQEWQFVWFHMARMIYCSPLRETNNGGGYVADFALLTSDKPFRFSRITYRGEIMFEKGRGGPWAGFFISYDGSQKQPDPILNAAIDGNAPIYRGKSYVVFNDLPWPQDFRPHEVEFWPPESDSAP